MAESKVQFNLKNVHYAVLTEGTSGATFGTPVKVAGAVSITLDQEGEQTVFYADGIKYFIAQANAGYSGSLELARVPDKMLADIWGMQADDEDVIIETVNDQAKDFALLFEIDGDQDGQKFAFYKCTASRPSIASQTNSETKEPQTVTLSLNISPLANGKIKAKTSAETSAEAAGGWFSAVYQ